MGGSSDALIQMGLALLLGGLLGLERRVHGRWADVRTHMLVSMGAALFMAVGHAVAPGSTEITRIVQGIAAGVGFLGAGTILKLSDRLEVKGLTTASSIWLAAGVGTAAGCGAYRVAIGATVMSVVVLVALRPLEKRFGRRG